VPLDGGVDGLDLPVTLLVGTASPASSRAVARLLAGALPRLRRVELGGGPPAAP